MLWTNIKRIIRTGFVSFWRNGVVSLSSVLVMTVTLFVLGTVIFSGAMLNATLTQLKDKVDVNVYFTMDAQEDDILALKRQLDAQPEVASTEYVSREQALEQFRTRHQDDQLTLQALEELSENPLGANISIQAQDPSQYERIANFLESNESLTTVEGESIVDKVNFFQNRVAIERLSTIISSAERLGYAIILVLVITSSLIVFNTTRLAIHTARDEIAVMRLVGASNAYIRGPFVFEGVMYGLIAGLITLVIFYPIALWLGPVTENFFGNINLYHYFLNNFGRIFAIMLGSGIALGGLSSYLAVRRYLKI